MPKTLIDKVMEDLKSKNLKVNREHIMKINCPDMYLNVEAPRFCDQFIGSSEEKDCKSCWERPYIEKEKEE